MKRIRYSLRQLLVLLTSIALALAIVKFPAAIARYRHYRYCAALQDSGKHIHTSTPEEAVDHKYDILGPEDLWPPEADGVNCLRLYYRGLNDLDGKCMFFWMEVRINEIILARGFEKHPPFDDPCLYGDVEMEDMGTLHIIRADEEQIVYAFTHAEPPSLLDEKTLVGCSTDDLIIRYQKETAWRIRLQILRVLERRGLTMDQWITLARSTTEWGLNGAICRGIAPHAQRASPAELKELINTSRAMGLSESLQWEFTDTLAQHPDVTLADILSLYGKIENGSVLASAAKPLLSTQPTNRLLEVYRTHPDYFLQKEIVYMLRDRAATVVVDDLISLCKDTESETIQACVIGVLEQRTDCTLEQWQALSALVAGVRNKEEIQRIMLDAKDNAR